MKDLILLILLIDWASILQEGAQRDLRSVQLCLLEQWEGERCSLHICSLSPFLGSNIFSSLHKLKELWIDQDQQCLILRFAETRRASLFRTFPQRSATLSPGSSARWRLFLCQGWSLLIEMRYFITQSFVSDWSRSPTASKCPRRFASMWRPTPRRFNNHRLNIVSPLQKMLRCWSRWWRSGATSHLTSRPPQQDLLLGSSSQTRYNY